MSDITRDNIIESITKINTVVTDYLRNNTEIKTDFIYLYTFTYYTHIYICMY